MDFFEFAEGSAIAPNGDDGGDVRKRFNSSARKAWTYIYFAIESDQQVHVRETITAKEAWDAL